MFKLFCCVFDFRKYVSMRKMRRKCTFMCRNALKMHLRFIDDFWPAHWGPSGKAQKSIGYLAGNAYREGETGGLGHFFIVSPAVFIGCVKTKNS
jgi:hypothetical protein